MTVLTDVHQSLAVGVNVRVCLNGWWRMSVSFGVRLLGVCDDKTIAVDPLGLSLAAAGRVIGRVRIWR